MDGDRHVEAERQVQDDRQLNAAQAIRELLAARSPGATICPSEAARVIAGEDFRALMPVVRDAARGLAEAREIEVTQRGRVVNLDDARGAIRLRLRHRNG